VEGVPYGDVVRKFGRPKIIPHSDYGIQWNSDLEGVPVQVYTFWSWRGMEPGSVMPDHNEVQPWRVSVDVESPDEALALVRQAFPGAKIREYR
jgi:hypothetical protein